jgi:hypothetical protein
MTEDQRQIELHLRLEKFGTERSVNILRAEMQCIDIPKEADSGWWDVEFTMLIVNGSVYFLGKKWAMVVDTRFEDARHVVTLRSLVNVIT